MSKDVIQFKISLPTAQGFIGRECNNPDCERYFKVHKNSLKQEMFCPYCGIQFSNNELWTKDQNKYVRKVAEEKTKEVIHQELDKIFSKFARQTSPNKFLKVTYKPKHYRAKPVHLHYKEPQVDSELVCPTCNFRFQVYGIFGYCPGCASENLLIYDANLEIIKQEVSTSQDPQRALRHAYADLVSAFESFCRIKAQLLTSETTRFQMLFEARRFFTKHFGIDIFEGLDNDDLLAMRRVFQKRHAYEHYQGIIEEKYVRMIPEDKNLLNQKAELSLDEFVHASRAIRLALDNLVRTIEKRK